MITAALWYVDQWVKHPFGGEATKSMMKPGSSGEYEMMPAALVYGLATAGIPAVHLAGMPYHKLANWTYDAYDYLDRTEPIVRHSQLARGGMSRKLWLKRGFSKLATRAIPGIGWALFAYDIYSVSKWYLETDF